MKYSKGTVRRYPLCAKFKIVSLAGLLQSSGFITKSAKTCKFIPLEFRFLWRNGGRLVVPARCALSATLVLVEVRKSSDRGNHVH